MRPFPKPKSDFAKPTGPQHDYPAWVYYGDPRCSRCNKPLSEVERTGASCVSDKHIQAGQVFTKVTK